MSHSNLNICFYFIFLRKTGMSQTVFFFFISAKMLSIERILLWNPEYSFKCCIFAYTDELRSHSAKEQAQFHSLIQSADMSCCFFS